MISRLAAGLVLLATPAFAQQTPGPWDAVARALGKPTPAAGETFRATFPRTDLHVRVGTVAVEPAFALTSWAAFAGPPDSCDMMGDLVLAEGEVAPVLSGLVAAGIEVTAVHHHLLGETPRVLYLHYHGRGAGADLAAKLRAVLAHTATPLGGTSTPPATRVAGLDTAALFAAIGAHGRLAGDVAQLSVPTSGSHPSMDGRPIPAALGVNTAIGFQPIGGGRAATTGDFVLAGDRVQGVLRALTAAGIRPTAIHSHMTTEEPRAIFVHFWGEGDPLALAKGLKEALQAAQ
jgi:uncharacterized protein DUF1259